MALGAENRAFSDSGQALNVMGRQFPNSSFLTRLGVHELYSPEMWRAAFTELVASATFLFTLSTTIIACLESHETAPKLVIPVAVFFIALFWLLPTVPLSGGFFSPTFTFMAALRGVISFTRALFYCLGQCLGAIIGYIILKSVMDPTIAHKYALGGCMVNGNGEGVSAGTALMIEFSCTFLVLYTAMTIVLDKKKCQDLGLTMVCIIISGAYAVSVFVSTTVTGRVGYGGVGLNPARCLAPALLLGGALWDGHWVFWVGPVCACSVYYVCSLMLPKQGFVRADEEQHVLQLVRSSCLGSESANYFEGKV
ncbi:probable aquaporin PIP2-6 [Ricinus communis]|uniref:Aquaporin transporter, putative n=1 Tax=Ricinus communis TaxID=3988 RepID=B9T717_RICCO|nr:probable aquaporin PIP2-6 [Ricinus communis]EEF28349.1 aquaporin transporter, putative [Ricinus communis]|eukprot:XP_002534036.1 probable aquaporin PIP2-6 [Ricinus communis]